MASSPNHSQHSAAVVERAEAAGIPGSLGCPGSTAEPIDSVLLAIDQIDLSAVGSAVDSAARPGPSVGPAARPPAGTGPIPASPHYVGRRRRAQGAM